jgi:hypothetical protein
VYNRHVTWKRRYDLFCATNVAQSTDAADHDHRLAGIGKISYVWTYPRERRLKVLQRLGEHRATKRVMVLGNRVEMRKFLNAMQREHSDSSHFLQLADQH